MKKYLFMIFITLFLFPFPAHSARMYVDDNLIITVRTQPGLSFKVIDQLSSDEEVNLLRIEESWALISFKDNKTGWVLERFLTEETPKPVTIAQLEKTITTQAEKIEALEKENMALTIKKAEMVEKVSSLSLKNQELREQPYMILLLLTGSGIFLVGCIVTLMLQKTGRKKRNKLSF